MLHAHLHQRLGSRNAVEVPFSFSPASGRLMLRGASSWRHVNIGSGTLMLGSRCCYCGQKWRTKTRGYSRCLGPEVIDAIGFGATVLLCYPRYGRSAINGMTLSARRKQLIEDVQSYKRTSSNAEGINATMELVARVNKGQLHLKCGRN
ncbi:hypothetical protein FB107DRAFT_246845 [Schizophyllum commune]